MGEGLPDNMQTQWQLTDNLPNVKIVVAICINAASLCSRIKQLTIVIDKQLAAI